MPRKPKSPQVLTRDITSLIDADLSGTALVPFALCSSNLDGLSVQILLALLSFAGGKNSCVRTISLETIAKRIGMPVNPNGRYNMLSDRLWALDTAKFISIRAYKEAGKHHLEFDLAPLWAMNLEPTEVDPVKTPSIPTMKSEAVPLPSLAPLPTNALPHTPENVAKASTVYQAYLAKTADKKVQAELKDIFTTATYAPYDIILEALRSDLESAWLRADASAKAKEAEAAQSDFDSKFPPRNSDGSPPAKTFKPALPNAREANLTDRSGNSYHN